MLRGGGPRSRSVLIAPSWPSGRLPRTSRAASPPPSPCRQPASRRCPRAHPSSTSSGRTTRTGSTAASPSSACSSGLASGRCSGGGWRTARPRDGSQSGADRPPVGVGGSTRRCSTAPCSSACSPPPHPTAQRPGDLLLPLAVERYTVTAAAPARVRAEVRVQRAAAGGSVVASVRLLDPDGTLVAALDGVRFAPADPAALTLGASPGATAYELRLAAGSGQRTRDRSARPGADAGGSWIVLADGRVGDDPRRAPDRGGRTLPPGRDRRVVALRSRRTDGSWRPTTARRSPPASPPTPGATGGPSGASSTRGRSPPAIVRSTPRRLARDGLGPADRAGVGPPSRARSGALAGDARRAAGDGHGPRPGPGRAVGARRGRAVRAP